MASKVFMPLINRLAPAIPAWFIINQQLKAAVIKPCRLHGLSRLKFGRIRQRKAEEPALSGKQYFESREVVLKKRQCDTHKISCNAFPDQKSELSSSSFSISYNDAPRQSFTQSLFAKIDIN